MDLKQLNTFRTIATLGSFSQAANLLDLAQSTVSDQMKALESDLEIKLFNRNGKKNSLTPAGELFLQYAQKMINLEEEIRTEIKGCEEVHGSLTIRIPETISTYYLPPVLKGFNGRYPHVDIHFNPCTSFGLLEELRAGIINLAFLITKDFKEADLETYKLMEVPLVIITYPGNPIAVKSSVNLDDFKNEPVYVTSSDCNYFKIFENFFINEKIKLPTLYRLNSIEGIKKNIIAGTGAAVLPKIAVEQEISKGLLVELPFEKNPLNAVMLMIRSKNKWHPPILESFMDNMKQSLTAASCTSNPKTH
jgi:DNA-binding transcriptional LysR family regulator